MKIGIVGSGIAGLTAAYRLHRAGHQVVIFEKQNSLGMDAHSLSLEIEANAVRADVPSRMFNELQWPNLIRLYRELGVEFKKVSTTQSFSWLGGETYLKLDVANRPWMAARSLLSSRFRKFAAEAKRLQTIGTQELDDGLGIQVTLSDYLAERDFDSSFVNEFLFPTLSSTVLTCSYQALDNYPAALVLQALKNLTESPALLRTTHGTQDVVQRLTSGIEEIRFGTMVTGSKISGDSVEVKFGAKVELFDHLIIATQANQAIRLFPNSALQSELSSVAYEEVEVVVHTDTRLMPQRESDWSTFNMISPSEERTAMCSVWLNQFHDEWALDGPVFQTINPFVSAEPDKVISKVALQRPVVTSASFKNWLSIEEYHQGHPNVWFVGSYATAGVPLLETGVQSSQDVVARILAARSASRSLSGQIST